MNKNIKLAVAGAVLALSATANAGIIIPAGDWTLDIGGNVNTYVTSTRNTGTSTTGYATLWSGAGNGDALGAPAAVPNKSTANITTGLLPNYLSVSGSTRQNDLDVAFTISINPGSSTTGSGYQSAQQENRQAFLTFGDKSWGSIKLGKDLGIFASDAILNDMTLLGVGSGAGGLAGNTTTTGRIGTGFMYADWKAQAAYTTPNFGGFQATVGTTQAWDAWSNIVNNTSSSATVGDAISAGRGGSQNAYEGKASYSFAANDVTGKVWVSGMYQKVENLYAPTNLSTATAAYANGKITTADDNVWATDIGANVNVAGFGFTGYYYTGEGIGQTKLGLSWGESKLEKNGSGDTMTADLEDSMWAAGLYHPITKHLNLVAEYSDVESKYGTATAKGRTGSLGAILFF